jgi:hypothetical protein
MLGRNPSVDRADGAPAHPGYDAQTKFGAGILYDDGVAFAYVHAQERKAPYWTTLHASNKESEHNIGNMPVRIVVAQLANQTQARNLKTLVSQRITLRPGSQSLGGT